MDAKRAAAERAADYVEDGMVVGLGTGSTAYWAIRKLGLRVKEGLRIRAVATSVQSDELARELGIPMIGFAEIDDIDVTIDGADEVDHGFHLIKGGGGALLREKIVAAASRQFIVIVDASKLVASLGQFPLPVEIVKFGCEATLKKLALLGCEPRLRFREGLPFATDNGNYIADCHFGKIEAPRELHDRINGIPGVVDNGLFVNMANRVVVGYENGDARELARE